jgi:hypothetical protein
VCINVATGATLMHENMRSETTDSADAATQIEPRVVLPDDGHGRGKDDTRKGEARQMVE